MVTAAVLYIPGGLFFLVKWGRKGLLNWKNLTLSFTVGGVLIMLLPAFARAIIPQTQLAKIFHLVR